MFHVFTRTWWTVNKGWPEGLEPKAGRKTYVANFESEEDARAYCQRHNAVRPQSWLKLSRKYEYES